MEREDKMIVGNDLGIQRFTNEETTLSSVVGNSREGDVGLPPHEITSYFMYV